ncbi:hypothetical protein BGZ80_001677 [Entomortierella chlamydospora]|uniref:Uncharacterized protein n=1 Tax=Entomortierella chlamydospora TaxID=101097 RepID=A0A9P6N1L2_9FUNG|nr:hypothetical protein BGZ80_001677 [Entomortierella chlamydospora]
MTSADNCSNAIDNFSDSGAGPSPQNLQPHSHEANQSTNESSEPLDSVLAVATELAEEFSIEPLSASAVTEAQGQIQTVALQMDGVRTQIGEIKSQLPGLQHQTKALFEGAEALNKMYRQIDELALLVEMVATSVHEANTKVEEAEHELTSAALQPLQAVLETLKMGPKGFR